MDEWRAIYRNDHNKRRNQHTQAHIQKPNQINAQKDINFCNSNESSIHLQIIIRIQFHETIPLNCQSKQFKFILCVLDIQNGCERKTTADV